MKTILLAAVGFALLAAPVEAQEDAASFYRGKTVRLVVGVGVGSGYDINARLLARHLPKHIPGNPQVIVQNQPGAGSQTMTNQLYAAGPFDGSLSAKRGERPRSSLRGASRQMVDSMSEAELERMASVKRKSLPRRRS